MPGLAGRIALGLASALVLALTGHYWSYLGGLEDGIEAIEVLGLGAGGDQPADGARDILLVGMDSRTDAKGRPLAPEKLKVLGAGKDGGQLNTDTLILVHIPNDNSKAVAISIPRDSYVELADGYGTHKINSTYGRAKTVERQRLVDAGVTDEKTLEVKSNAAGATLLRKTVEQLTGRTIDNYASVNLIGFYDITRAIGGVDVCLKTPVSEHLSHIDLPAGPQSISGSDALAFVRQRHGLPRGDLDRVVRQQVFMTGMARKILSAGTLTDTGKLSELIDALTGSVVINKDWNIMEFAQQMSGLTGGQIQFQTIPVGSLVLRTPNDGLAVEVDPNQVRDFMAGFSGSQSQDPPPEAAEVDKSEITVSVLNSIGVEGLAATVAARLTGKGFAQGEVGNAIPHARTVVRYAPGDDAAAQAVAADLGAGALIEEDASLSPGQVTVVIGDDFPHEESAATAGGGSSPRAGAQAPDQDQPITAGREVPCVN